MKISTNSTSLKLTLESRECRLTSQNELKIPGDGMNGDDWFLSSSACCRLGANSTAKTDVTSRLPELCRASVACSLAPLASQDSAVF